MNRPNIVLMIAHDLGRHLGCYGVPTVNTPNLDRLAGEGVRFARSFCVAPQCSPSRAALFTGRTPHQNGVMGLTHSHFAWDLHENERHLAGFLKDGGWHTALAGLQHETRRAQDMGWAEIISAGAPAPGTSRNGANHVAAQVVDFLGRRKSDDARPFYLQVGFAEPHRAPGTPGDFGNMPPDEEQGIYVPPYLVDDEAARDEFRHYQGAIRKLDDAVGEILAALDSDASLRENTLVIFTTDHGIPFPRAKCSVYDPGLETCLLLRWPAGGVEGGNVFEPMLPHTDILPTLLEIAGIPVPDNLVGRSFAPLLRGEAYEPRTEIFGELTFHDYCDPVRCVRTDRWKLLAAFSNAPSFMDPSQQWRPRTTTRVPPKPHMAYHTPVELYDLEDDPHETNNLADASEHAAVRADLLGRLHAWMKKTNDPLLTGIPLSPIHQATLAALRGA